MTSGINASLSGLNSSATRLNVSANNVANISSTKEINNGVEKNQKFIPSQVTDVSVGGSGGVKSIVRPDPLASNTNIAGIDAGAQSNVDVSTETVNQLQAKNAYEANLKALEVQNKTEQETLNIVS